MLAEPGGLAAGADPVVAGVGVPGILRLAVSEEAPLLKNRAARSPTANAAPYTTAGRSRASRSMSRPIVRRSASRRYWATCSTWPAKLIGQAGDPLLVFVAQLLAGPVEGAGDVADLIGRLAAAVGQARAGPVPGLAEGALRLVHHLIANLADLFPGAGAPASCVWHGHLVSPSVRAPACRATATSDNRRRGLGLALWPTGRTVAVRCTEAGV